MRPKQVDPLRARSRRSGPFWRVAAAGLCAAMVLAGCSSAPTRATLTPEQFQQRSEADAAEMATAFQTGIGKVITRLEREEAADGGRVPTLNVLAMSGGGDLGAFGAGFLVGWGSAPAPEWKRPDFDVVTGVSTGALLAPFAYVGTDEACLKVESFYRNPKTDWLVSGGLLFFLPSNPSFMTLPGLYRDVGLVFNKEFVAQMAAQSRADKLLIISSTDLDLGRQKFWEVGEEAETATTSGDPERLHKILLSSAAIPAAFPPVQIGDSLYADGGVTANVFLRLEAHNPNGLIQRWKVAHPGKPFPKTRYWVIINNQLNHTPKTVQQKWPEVIGPSLETAVRCATAAEVRWLAAKADYCNAVFGTDIEVRLTAIPDSWRPPVEGDFQKETMTSLADLGRKLGADPSCWKLMTLPVQPSTGKQTGMQK